MCLSHQTKLSDQLNAIQKQLGFKSREKTEKEQEQKQKEDDQNDD
jgi:hypothetical protein